MRLFIPALAGIGLLAAIGTAHAGTYNYSGYSVLNPQVVTLQDSTLGINESGYAGQVTIKGTDGSSISTFCFDIADNLQATGSFSTGSVVTGAAASAVNALISHVLPTLSTSQDASAALQIAIWDTKYGTGSGGVTVTSADSNALTLASSYLNQVSTGAWQADPTMAVNLLAGGGKTQDQIYLSRVPEPATIGIIGVALLALFAVTRRVRHGR